MLFGPSTACELALYASWRWHASILNYIAEDRGDLTPLLRPRSARHDLLVQLLIDGLNRPVDFGAGRAELVRDQLHQQVDALDERCAGDHRAGCGRRSGDASG